MAVTAGHFDGCFLFEELRCRRHVLLTVMSNRGGVQLATIPLDRKETLSVSEGHA